MRIMDTLEIFGVEYENATGIRATDENGVLRSYIRPSGSVNITSNSTVDVTQYAQAVVNVEGGGSGSNDLIVSLSWDSTEEKWVPNKTFSEISTAYTNNVPIYVTSSNVKVLGCAGTYDEDTDIFGYIIVEDYDEDEDGYGDSLKLNTYDYTSEGLELTFSLVFYPPSEPGAEDYIFELAQDQTDTSLFLPVDSYEDVIAGISGAHSNYKDVFFKITDYATGILGQCVYSDNQPPEVINNKNYFKYTTYYTFSFVQESQVTITKIVLGYVNNVYEYVVVWQKDYYPGVLRDSTDLTVSGSTVTAPAGYYASAASKSVASGTATTPATTVTANPSITVNASGLITATASATQSVTPTVSEGYVSSGTAGTITVSGSNTSQLSTQAAATITPTESEQTAVAAGKYTTGVVKVGAISSTYVGSGITRRDETDLSASGDTVTVPAGYYESQETKSVTSGTVYPPSSVTSTSDSGITITTDSTNNKFTMSASVLKTPDVETAGYISSGSSRAVDISLTKTIPINSSTDLTVSGATVTAPAGYYAAAASKAVSTGSVSTPASTITANPSISVSSSGLITASVSTSSSITPTVSAGYISSGTAGTITVSGSTTNQLSTVAGSTITPSES